MKRVIVKFRNNLSQGMLIALGQENRVKVISESEIEIKQVVTFTDVRDTALLQWDCQLVSRDPLRLRGPTLSFSRDSISYITIPFETLIETVR